MDCYLNEICDLQNNDVCTIYTLKLNVQDKRFIEFLFLFWKLCFVFYSQIFYWRCPCEDTSSYLSNYLIYRTHSEY